MLEVLFKKKLLKSSAALFSNWSTTSPTEPQIRSVLYVLPGSLLVLVVFSFMFHRYASDDAIGHLRCLNKLLDMPDLTRRLRVGQDVVGLKVDITPLNGSLVCMATCAATAIIQEPAAIEPPQGVKANT